METEKLYYADPYETTFTATVLGCEAGKGGYLVTLDRTAFYPEGGGQPADHGTLGGAAVTDVHEKDGVIAHTCDRPLTVGDTVEGAIDWDRRFDHMQQHSGEHILSGLICAAHHCDNVGFHLGADTVTIDFNAALTEEDVAELESAANRYIWQDHPIAISFPSPEELEALDYRSKKELTGQVRIVAFPGADCCACCGTHVASSGQVGLLKILSCQKFRQGVRLEILSGRRALTYLSRTWDQNRQVGQRLSAKATETAAAVERLEAELTATKDRCAALERTVFAAKAEEYRDKGDVTLLESPMGSDAVRRLADTVAGTCGGRCWVFAGEGEHWNYAMVDHRGGDVKELVGAVNAALHGRGGGKKGFAQGSVQATRQEIEDYFA